MCGRLRLDDPSLKYFMQELEAEVTTEFIPLIANNLPLYPNFKILAFVKRQNETKLESFVWGWGKLYNARIETATSERSNVWKDSYKSKRCLIPVTAFWERSAWFGRNNFPLMLAGLYNEFQQVSILTMPAVHPISTVHHRMPAIITSPWWPEWLNEDLAGTTGSISGLGKYAGMPQLERL